MKRSILMFLVIGTAIIFFGCSGDNPMAPKSNQSDQVTNSLAKGNMKTLFEGRCDWVLDIDGGKTTILPNGKTQIKGQTSQWYDDADDWMVTGDSFWDVNWLIEEDGNAKIWGKAEIIVDDDGGKWELSWHGWRTPTGEGPFIEWVSPFKLVVDAIGTGTEGDVKGLVAKWTFTMDFNGDMNTLFYATKGYIIKK